MKWYEYIGIVLYVIFAYFINKYGLDNVSILIFLIGIGIASFSLEKGLKFFLLNVLSFSDFSFENMYLEGLDAMPLGGIYMAKLGGATIIVYWSIILTVLILLRRMYLTYTIVRENKLLSLLFFILVISIIGMCLSFMFNTAGLETLRMAISDIGFFINIFIGFFLIYCLVRNRSDYFRYFNIFVVIFMTQIIISFISSSLLLQTHTLFNFTSGTESYLIATVFIYFLIKAQDVKSSKTGKLISIIGLIILIMFLLIVAARGRIFILGFSIVVYLIYKKEFKLLFFAPIVFLIAYQIVDFINPNFLSYFMWKLTTFNPLEEGADSSNVRYISFMNILGESMSNPFYFFFGKGLGGYFEAKFMPFTMDLTKGGAFNASWIIEGKFYRPHGIILYSLLKFGILMSIILFTQLLRYCYKGLVMSSQEQDLHAISVAIFITLPVFFIVIFSTKLQILFGILLGFSWLIYQTVYHKQKFD